MEAGAGLRVFLHTGLTAAYISRMDDNDRTPGFAADGLETHIEAGLRELEAGKGRPMSEFVAELKADFRAAYPEIVEMLQPPPVRNFSHN